jgi:hypothetical protein
MLSWLLARVSLRSLASTVAQCGRSYWDKLPHFAMSYHSTPTRIPSRKMAGIEALETLFRLYLSVSCSPQSARKRPSSTSTRIYSSLAAISTLSYTSKVTSTPLTQRLYVESRWTLNITLRTRIPGSLQSMKPATIAFMQVRETGKANW